MPTQNAVMQEADSENEMIFKMLFNYWKGAYMCKVTFKNKFPWWFHEKIIFVLYLLICEFISREGNKIDFKW